MYRFEINVSKIFRRQILKTQYISPMKFKRLFLFTPYIELEAEQLWHVQNILMLKKPIWYIWTLIWS